jgi:hypothetical protein
MTRALWIPDQLEAAGLTVIREWGWDLRGSASFNPQGVVCHHTASAPGNNAPSLGICINGRPDLPGPLCQILIARDGTCHVIASGTANHAGAGGWRGLTGNTSVFGIEVENNGLGEPWSDHLLDVFARACAALLRGMGDTDADNVCLHREWAPTRKPDPAGPGFPQDGNTWRTRVQAALNEGTDDMPLTKEDLFAIGVVVKKCLADEGFDEVKAEVEGLKKRTQLIRRIARAVAHKAGVTQSEIEAQA